MTKGEEFMRNAKGNHGHRSAMSNSALCDFNLIRTVLKLHDMSHNLKCNCQKQTIFTPKQFQLEGNGFKNTMKKRIKGSQIAWNKFLRPAINATAPFRGMAVSAKTNPEVGTATSNILKSRSGGKILSLTVMRGHGLRLKMV